MSAGFEPIAIVGRGCVLPGGCLSPAALWQAVADNRSLLSRPPVGVWGVTAAEAAAMPYRGGYVTGFEDVFEPARYDCGNIDLSRIDPVFTWPLHAGGQALAEAGAEARGAARSGVVLANLSYPSRQKSDYCGDIWTQGRSHIAPVNMFNSSAPAQLLARAFGLETQAFALDAACASSLYALAMACGKLQSGALDLALVAGVNAADSLMLHRGFAALQALSPSGRSRPFAADADGLVPAQGAAAVVLKRLRDVEDGERVSGVIAGIGLSNDGRRRGLVAPDRDGQVEAMVRAWQAAGLEPAQAQLLECHATGTRLGDGVEIASSAEVFAQAEGLPIGSLKSNSGHLITVAGLASLIKLLGGLEHDTLAPTRLFGEIHPALGETGLVLQTSPTPWERGSLRCAAISNFGFGGNNGHLVLCGHDAPSGAVAGWRMADDSARDDPVVVCGIGVLAGPDQGAGRLLRRLTGAAGGRNGRSQQIGVNPRFARTPPDDLAHAEAQQLAMLAVSEEALQAVTPTPPERAGLLVAMECAADSTRWLLRERLARRLALAPDAPGLDDARAQIIGDMTPADVLGAMPNIPANRLSAALDFRGPGFTVSAGARSGVTVLELASDALRNGALDMVLVGAADFATETVRARALGSTGETETTADMAVALVLKRRSDAIATGDPVWAELGAADQASGPVAALLNARYGSAPVADQLMALASRALQADRGLESDGEAVWPAMSQGAIAARPSPDPLRPAPFLYYGAARSREGLAARLEAAEPGGSGDFRIAIHAETAGQLDARCAGAMRQLRSGGRPVGEGLDYGEGPPDGDLAFVFTGSAAAYPRMGRGLFAAFPELGPALAQRHPAARRLAPLLARPQLTAYEQLCAVTLVSQAQSLLLREFLGVQPVAALGLSLGETNALIAFGFWSDAGHLLDEIAAHDMYDRHIGGRFETAAESWGERAPVAWTNWRVYAPISEVKEAIEGLARTEINIIYSPEDCVIGGPPEQCRTLSERLGKGRAVPMNQHLLVHARAMAPYAERWRELHTRPTRDVQGVRLYSNALGRAYRPDDASAAQCLTAQAVETVDFPRTVERAYADGVRSFVEIGPRDTLAVSIGKILEGRPHLALACDRVEASDLGQLARLAGALFAAGHPVDIAQVAGRLEAARAHPWPAVSGNCLLELPAHFAPPEVDLALGTERAPPPVASQASGAKPLLRRLRSGPAYDRAALEAATRGPVSELFGEAFAAQDGFARQVRLPAPPLLLADRVTGIDAEPLKAGPGVIWTETEIPQAAWFLHQGFMRPGPLIEAGQADLTLISWMGADMHNRDERVYRLLGCELTLHEGGLPRPGETLQYQIEITGHAVLSGVRMFFFQYDCRADGRLLFSVRSGQAGFFTDDELASGKGVLWDPEKDGPPTADAPAFDISRASGKRSFSAPEVAAWRAGDGYACFGEGFELCAAMTNPPHLPGDKLALFDSVPVFEPEGGPWRRGYLKACADVPVDAWFYDGHFHNDPCMPGTLMAEAAVQALEFAAAALGLVTRCDGFVFEPVPGLASKFICRGQVIPDTPHRVEYEVFVDRVIEGDMPEIHAALLATSDGRKVFYCPRFAVRLRRNWPVVPADTPRLEIGPMAESRGDRAALNACGDGAPSEAFGAMYAPFDHAGRVPRLPQPPYHMISRARSVSTRPNAPEIGAQVETEYDVPEEAWYFRDGGNGVMPFAVLLEVILQPCGWLASHGGFALHGGDCFRNLDGEGVVHCEVRPGDGPVHVRAVMSNFSRAGATTIVFFDVEATLGDGRRVMTLKTSFGFFPAKALERQAGLKVLAGEREMLDLPGAERAVPQLEPAVASGMMEMIDRVDLFEPEGGPAGLGRARARQSIDPYAWYFKAHFYQDPVQPGSLGLDALLQLLQRMVKLKRLGEGMDAPRFETLAREEPIKWSYRGQVTPRNREVITMVDITEIREVGEGRIVIASGSLWCDGLKIYAAEGLSVRVMPSE